MVVVRKTFSIKSKLEDQGMICMFLGYAQNHMGGAFCMFNLSMKLIVLIRDVIWLSTLYTPYKGIIRNQE